MDKAKIVPKTLSARLILALKQLNVSQAELSRRIGITQQAIQHLCKSKSNYSKFTFEIAAALDIDPVWLATGKGCMLPEHDPHKQIVNAQQQVPILSEKEIISFCLENKSFKDLAVEQWILSDVCKDNKCVGYLLKDKSMTPRFDENTIIILDPSREPKGMDFVLTYIKSENAIIFRQLQIKNGKKILQPMNKTLYNSITFEKGSAIIGTMCEARWKIN